ncbi:uncharacterized protein BXIN_2468 [Babesia sp. Xinjiang]|uniref:uncharacterized protein n=1 Tax=Babesia sp. Xinjiang TaxID=462227 RepID=UPI000A264FA0|nr:uncharacterized protein BXIN_2468 [Babesia sp. Xinjiang]ORM41491.1 hypothetical protein BXIN_2468 [Babesia sp. Xinjiang]
MTLLTKTGPRKCVDPVKREEASNHTGIPSTKRYRDLIHSDGSAQPKGSVPSEDSSSSYEVGAYALRKRKIRTPVDLSPRAEVESHDFQAFSVESEARAWDAFYTDGRDSDAPFSGFDTRVTVKMLRTCLRKIRSLPLIDSNDVLLEVGHGKHPLIWDLKRSFGKFKFYTGIEFSGDSIFEAIKLRKRTTVRERAAELGDNVEFLRATSIDYFNADGSCSAEVILPSNANAPRLFAGSVTLVLAKSTLDYVTCRLTGSVDTLEWDQQPSISPSVVRMFDTFSTALGKADDDRVKAVIFVEPGDFVKFRDHIATIARVIYAATFRDDSPAKWLRLTQVQRHKSHRAVCYTLQKTSESYSSYQELRKDICRLTARLYDLSDSQDGDWLLPLMVPPKWNSSYDADFEQLLAI